ncbi:MAG: hypothetical protein LBG12_07985 [Synergistaceae bacterium]|jgi:hypothetical protein|nr:hypothetical protein [Synergistaceae bacterium]
MKKKFWLLLLTVFIILIASRSYADIKMDDFLKLCARGNPEDVKNAIISGTDVNARDEKGEKRAKRR